MNNIAVIGINSFDSLAWNLNFTLKGLGYQAKIFDIYFSSLEVPTSYLIKLSSNLENVFFYQLAYRVINYKPKLVLCLFRNIPPFVIDLIKKETNAKIIFLTGDHLGNLERGYVFVSNFDAFFIKDKYLVDLMKKKLGLNSYYLPESFNPDIHSNSLLKTDFGSLYDVSVIGTLYPYRTKILEQLTNEYNLSLFGSKPRWLDKKWNKYFKNEYLVGNKKSNVFFQSKINLNTLRYEEITGANCRVFEIAGSGGFQICDKKEGIKELFEEDKEIVMFDTINELKEKINYYLKNQDKAFEIAQNSKQRALKEHTYEHRIKEIFKTIGFKQ